MLPEVNSSILFVQYGHSGAYPPVLNACRIFKQRKCRVRIICTCAQSQSKMSIPSDVADEVVLNHLPSNRIWLKFFYFWFSLKTALAIVRSRSSWIYASDPMVCFAVLLALMVSKKKVIYHEHDSLDINDPSKTKDLRTWIVVKTRNAIAKRAAICVLPNLFRAQTFQEFSGIQEPPMVVWNCPSKQELIESAIDRDSRAVVNDVLRVTYCGSLNETRVPFSYAEALVLEPRIELTLIGYETIGSQGFSERFLEFAKQIDVDSRVKILGPIPRDQVFEALKRSHIAIATVPLDSTDINMLGMLGASNKSFDGLSCAIPTLVSNLQDWENAFVRRGVARMCDPLSPISIAEALKWFADHPSESNDMGRRGRSLIESEWNYEAQFEKVLARMDQLAA